MRLEVNGIDVTCVIGDLPEERIAPGRLAVDVALETPDLAAETDAIGDAVDYVAVADAVREALVRGRCRLVERAAKVACEACLALPRVLAAEVRVTKAGAVPGLASVAATWRQDREGKTR